MAEEEPFHAPRADPEEESAHRQIDEAMRDEAIERSIRLDRGLRNYGVAIMIALAFAFWCSHYLWDKYSG